MAPADTSPGGRGEQAGRARPHWQPAGLLLPPPHTQFARRNGFLRYSNTETSSYPFTTNRAAATSMSRAAGTRHRGAGAVLRPRTARWLIGDLREDVRMRNCSSCGPHDHFPPPPRTPRQNPCGPKKSGRGNVRSAWKMADARPDLGRHWRWGLPEGDVFARTAIWLTKRAVTPHNLLPRGLPGAVTRYSLPVFVYIR